MAINVLIIDDNINNITSIGEALTELNKEILYFPTAKDNKDIEFIKKISSCIFNDNITDFADYIKDIILAEDIDIVILDLALAQREEMLGVYETTGIKLMQTLLKLNIAIFKYIPFFIYSALNIKEIKQSAINNIVYAGEKPAIVTVDSVKIDFKKSDYLQLNILLREARRFKRLKSECEFLS